MRPVFSALLITGCLGFMGSHFTNTLVNKYPNTTFIGLDKADYNSSLKNLTVLNCPNFSLVRGEVGSADLVRFLLQKHKIEAVVHFSALSSVDLSFYDPVSFTVNNTLGTHVLLEECRKYSALKLFLHISTDEVYGESSIPLTEEGNMKPTNPYSASKAGADLLVQAYQSSYNLPTIILRPNNFVGIGQYPEKLIPKFIMKLLEKEKVPIHGEGKNRRSFLHSKDLVSACELLLLKGEVGEIYNIGSEEEYSVLEITEMLREELCPERSLEEIVEYVEDRPYNDDRYLIDDSKLKSLGWRRWHSLKKELPSIVEWYRKHGKEHWNVGPT